MHKVQLADAESRSVTFVDGFPRFSRAAESSAGNAVCVLKVGDQPHLFVVKEGLYFNALITNTGRRARQMGARSPPAINWSLRPPDFGTTRA